MYVKLHQQIKIHLFITFQNWLINNIQIRLGYKIPNSGLFKFKEKLCLESVKLYPNAPNTHKNIPYLGGGIQTKVNVVGPPPKVVSRTRGGKLHLLRSIVGFQYHVDRADVTPIGVEIEVETVGAT